MKNLGKIFFVLFLFCVDIFAQVKAYVDHSTVTLGDSVTYRIEVKGNDITPPQIDTLCNSDIVSSSSQQSIRFINGTLSKSYNFFYTFEPTQSCTIESVPVIVDGKTQKTQPIQIKVTNKVVQKNGDFILELKTDKKEVFVGESFDVDLVFKQKKSVQALDSKFYPPKLNGFWIKYQSKPQKTQERDYVVTTIHYKMAAQRAGELEIAPAKIKIAQRVLRRDFFDMMNSAVVWKTYFSNGIKMKVLAPPKGLKLVGDFTIDFQVDKTKVYPNEAVHGIITIKGEGNLEDIEKFNPYIQNANVFAKKPKIDEQNSVFTQEIAFVGDSDFTIPSMKLRFFNPKTKKIENLATKPIKITLLGAKKTQQNAVVVKKPTEDVAAANVVGDSADIDSSFAITWVILSFIAGIFVGGVVVYMKFGYQKQPKTKRFSYKDQKALFVKLLPYKEHKDVKEILDLLEESMYGSKTVELDMKKIKELVEKYNIA